MTTNQNSTLTATANPYYGSLAATFLYAVRYPWNPTNTSGNSFWGAGATNGAQGVDLVGFCNVLSGQPFFDKNGAQITTDTSRYYPAQVTANALYGTVADRYAWTIALRYADTGRQIKETVGLTLYADRADGGNGIVKADGTPYGGPTGGNDPNPLQLQLDIYDSPAGASYSRVVVVNSVNGDGSLSAVDRAYSNASDGSGLVTALGAVYSGPGAVPGIPVVYHAGQSAPAALAGIALARNNSKSAANGNRAYRVTYYNLDGTTVTAYSDSATAVPSYTYASNGAGGYVETRYSGPGAFTAFSGTIDNGPLPHVSANPFAGTRVSTYPYVVHYTKSGVADQVFFQTASGSTTLYSANGVQQAAPSGYTAGASQANPFYKITIENYAYWLYYSYLDTGAVVSVATNLADTAVIGGSPPNTALYTNDASGASGVMKLQTTGTSGGLNTGLSSSAYAAPLSGLDPNPPLTGQVYNNHDASINFSYRIDFVNTYAYPAPVAVTSAYTNSPTGGSTVYSASGATYSGKGGGTVAPYIYTGSYVGEKPVPASPPAPVTWAADPGPAGFAAAAVWLDDFRIGSGADDATYATSFDGTMAAPGFKGSDIVLDGFTGAVWVQKSHDVNSYTLTVEIDPGNTGDLYRQLDALLTAAGRGRIRLKVQRPTGEVRVADDVYLSGAAQVTTVIPNEVVSVALAFTLPYPFWRSENKVTALVYGGSSSAAEALVTLPQFQGCTAPVEDLTLTVLATASGAASLRETRNNRLTSVSKIVTIDCGTWTVVGLDSAKGVAWDFSQSRIFTLPPTGPYVVPTVKAVGNWQITGYRRFLTP